MAPRESVQEYLGTVLCVYACMRREHNIRYEKKLLQLLKQLYLNTCIDILFQNLL